jgi:Domain of unknown function (DUF5753)
MDSNTHENRLVSWKAAHGSGLDALQKVINEQEASSRLYKSFQISVVPALLQTLDYAQWVISNVEPDFSPSRHLSNSVAARIRRQAILENPGKVFQFVLYEPVLTRSLSGDIMIEQIERLRELAKRDNVSIGVLPLDSSKPVIPVNTYVIYDDEFVSGVTIAHRMEISLEEEVSMYVRNYELLKSASLWDEDLDTFFDGLIGR